MKLRFILLLIILVNGYSVTAQDTLLFPQVYYNPIRPGETLDYKVTFGIFSVGKATIETSEKLFRVNGRPCYKIEVKGKTSGAVDWVARVEDVWGTYMDSLSFMPYIGYRQIKENSYRKNEVTKFDQEKQMVELKVLNQKTGEYHESKIFQTMEPVRDLVSGYSFLRTLDYNGKTPGDIITLYGIFEDEFYEFQILFGGKDRVKTSIGVFDALKLIPVMPDNKLFAGENPITIWLSDDANKIPLKVEADMVVGKAGCEIIAVDRLKGRKSN